LPAEVLAETLNRIGNNIGRQDAVFAGKALLERNETGDILITHSSPALIAATIDLLKTVQEPPDKRASFVDCLVMATAAFYLRSDGWLMDGHGISPQQGLEK
jgi:hypothetical protein